MNEGGVCVILFNRLEDAFLGGMVHGDNEHEPLHGYHPFLLLMQGVLTGCMFILCPPQ